MLTPRGVPPLQSATVGMAPNPAWHAHSLHLKPDLLAASKCTLFYRILQKVLIDTIYIEVSCLQQTFVLLLRSHCKADAPSLLDQMTLQAT